MNQVITKKINQPIDDQQEDKHQTNEAEYPKRNNSFDEIFFPVKFWFGFKPPYQIDGVLHFCKNTGNAKHNGNDPNSLCNKRILCRNNMLNHLLDLHGGNIANKIAYF